MMFERPEWLLLVPILALLGWQFPGLGIHRPLRVATLLALVLALADPRWRTLADGIDLWVLVDRSDSASAALSPVRE